jgi:hypothetical protein
MKTLKIVSAVTAAILLAVLTVGANSAVEARPQQVPSERWIAIGPKAGFAVNTKLGGSRERSARGSQNYVAAELYIKTESGWRRAMIENPTYAMPLNP